ncbi:MAG: hypothetical protein JXB05_13630 [Myxococcaceae bacterium]|nr:hypothetical protein [Myxococcaceae bacterium]
MSAPPAPDDNEANPQARWIQMGIGVTVALAVTGFFVGIRPAPERPEPAPAAGTAAPAAERAPSYRELQEARRGANARMYEGALEPLRAGLDSRQPIPVATARQRAQAVADRKAHRAYDGAPPTVPHEVDPLGAPGCLACHERGMKLGARVAPRLSHPPYPNCNQCHAVEASPKPLAPYPDMPANHFTGKASAGNGSRAWLGAPPAMPHPVHMRSECGSCHGPTGHPGLRTSHPERQNCVQCHASSAMLDQRGTSVGLPSATGGAP